MDSFPRMTAVEAHDEEPRTGSKHVKQKFNLNPLKSYPLVSVICQNLGSFYKKEIMKYMRFVFIINW